MKDRHEHHYTTEEIGRRGRDIYERRIRREVEPEHRGKFIIIDITTGEYVIGESGREASSRMGERNPEAIMHGSRGRSGVPDLLFRLHHRRLRSRDRRIRSTCRARQRASRRNYARGPRAD